MHFGVIINCFYHIFYTTTSSLCSCKTLIYKDLVKNVAKLGVYIYNIRC